MFLTPYVPTLGWQRWVLYSDYWTLQRGRGKLFLSVRYRIYYNTVVVDVSPAGSVCCVARVPSKTQLWYFTSFGHMRAFNSLSRALSAVSQVWGRTGLKTRVMNNLLATFCLHFTRTFWFLLFTDTLACTVLPIRPIVPMSHVDYHAFDNHVGFGSTMNSIITWVSCVAERNGLSLLQTRSWRRQKASFRRCNC